MLTAFDGVSGKGDGGGREFGRGEGHHPWG